MIFYIDGDNSPGKGLENANWLPQNIRIKVFFADNNMYWRKNENQMRLRKSTNAQVEFFSVRQNPDGVDFAVAIDAVKECMEGERFFIFVSSDKHFVTIKTNLENQFSDIIVKNAKTISDGWEKADILNIKDSRDLHNSLCNRFGPEIGLEVYNKVKGIFTAEGVSQQDETDLTLPLSKKLFQITLSGERKEDYRNINKYYTSRFSNIGLLTKDGHPLDTEKIIGFRNGNSMESPMVITVCRISIGKGRKEWGANEDEQYILSIEKIIGTRNVG